MGELMSISQIEIKLKTSQKWYFNSSLVRFPSWVRIASDIVQYRDYAIEKLEK
jgi:hypothetical protein